MGRYFSMRFSNSLFVQQISQDFIFILLLDILRLEASHM